MTRENSFSKDNGGSRLVGSDNFGKVIAQLQASFPEDDPFTARDVDELAALMISGDEAGQSLAWAAVQARLGHTLS